MEKAERIAVGQGESSRYTWLLSGGILAAGVALWSTLLGLLYRVGWLSAFGLSQDMYIPSSATELTFWGYMALLQAWVVFQEDHQAHLFKLVGLTFSLACLGLGLGLVAVKHRHRLAEISQKRSMQASLAVARFLGLSALYPVVIFYMATVVVLSPIPAYFLAKSAAAKTIELYGSAIAAGARNCHRLRGPSGEIGTCPMIIVQTVDRIAFLDGRYVHVIPAHEVSIGWELPRNGIQRTSSSPSRSLDAKE